MYSVYGLGDPRTGQICYVGITQDVHKRYAQHLLYRNNEVKYNWLLDLRNNGLLPSLTILESDVDASIIYEREKYWIAYYLSENPSLTNAIIPRSTLKSSGYYSVEDIAKHFMVTERTIFRLMKQGKLIGQKIGRSWQFSQEDIDSFIESQRAEVGK